MVFLTLYTPTYRRPTYLERCKASVYTQTCQDVQHLIIEDTQGHGIPAMFADVANHHDKISGEYVMFLCDDDMLFDDHVVQDVYDVIQSTMSHSFVGVTTDVLMVKMEVDGRVYPGDFRAHNQPVCGDIAIGCWIVKKEVWTSHRYGERYEGDYDFIRSVFDVNKWTIAWYDRVVSRAQSGYHYGQPEG